AVDVDSDVVVSACNSFPCVEAHPDAYGIALGPVVAGQVPLGPHRSPHGPERAGERNEERVPLRADLDSTTLRDGPAHDGGVVVEDSSVPITELLEQPGGSLDIGEQEGDRAGRKHCHVQAAM